MALGMAICGGACHSERATPEPSVALVVTGLPARPLLQVGPKGVDLWMLCAEDGVRVIVRGAKNDAIGDCANRDVYEFSLALDAANGAGARPTAVARLVHRNNAEVLAVAPAAQEVIVKAPSATRAASAPNEDGSAAPVAADPGTGKGEGAGDKQGQGSAVTAIAVTYRKPLSPLQPAAVSGWQPGKHPQAGVPLLRLLEHYQVAPKDVAAIELYGTGSAPTVVTPAQWGEAAAGRWMAVKLNRHGMLRFVWMDGGRGQDKLKDISRIVLVPARGR